MESSTILTPPSTGLSGILQNPYQRLHFLLHTNFLPPFTFLISINPLLHMLFLDYDIIFFSIFRQNNEW